MKAELMVVTECSKWGCMVRDSMYDVGTRRYLPRGTLLLVLGEQPLPGSEDRMSEIGVVVITDRGLEYVPYVRIPREWKRVGSKGSYE